MIHIELAILITLNLLIAYKLLGRSRAAEDEAAETPASATTPVTAPAHDIAQAEAFAVPRRERRPSWRERRRQLEAAHRTERKKLEEWRD